MSTLHSLLAQRGALRPVEDGSGRAHLAISAGFTEAAFASAVLPQDNVAAVGGVLDAMLAGLPEFEVDIDL